MAATKPLTSVDVSDIQRQMAQIRNQMHQEVQGAVRSAHSLTDWQAMVKNHPWMSLSIASVVGYLLVPRRSAPVSTIVTMSTPSTAIMPASPSSAPAPAKRTLKLVGPALTLLAPVAVRVAQNYMLGQVEQWLAQHPLSAPAGRPVGRPTHEAGKSARQGSDTRLREFG